MTDRRLVTTLLMCIAMFGTYIAHAQDNTAKNRIESERIAFITTYVNLSPEEAEAFWPLYNEYQNKLVAKRNTSAREGRDMDEQEAAEQIDLRLDHEQEQLDLKREYVGKFRSVLSSKKTYLLFEAERKFKSRLLRLMNERRQRQQR